MLCECGCEQVTRFHKKRFRRFITGHNNIGKSHTKEWNEKIGRSKIGKKRMPFSQEWCDNLSKSLMGKNKGQKRTKEQCENISRSMIGKPAWNKNIPHKPETIEKIRIKRMSQVLPRKDTKPERMMQLALTLLGIKFEKHKAILGQPDIFIEPNICIFVDGDYWHNRSEVIKRDIFVNHELNKLGYQVIRIWEKDIKTNTQKVTNNLLNLIKLALLSP